MIKYTSNPQQHSQHIQRRTRTGRDSTPSTLRLSNLDKESLRQTVTVDDDRKSIQTGGRTRRSLRDVRHEEVKNREARRDTLACLSIARYTSSPHIRRTSAQPHSPLHITPTPSHIYSQHHATPHHNER
ncbi:hypothetical protein E2C01_034821 [Portunus trituberculatus]|uniref:Uncharacterized protein n=1 Tax=Portunus trituberculatus TaxID=210409 RepID=A0A5B7F9S6_PORTR|nr:hypothetical protein [Portunus trituberculatus]